MTRSYKPHGISSETCIQYDCIDVEKNTPILHVCSHSALSSAWLYRSLSGDSHGARLMDQVVKTDAGVIALHEDIINRCVKLCSLGYNAIGKNKLNHSLGLSLTAYVNHYNLPYISSRKGLKRSKRCSIVQSVLQNGIAYVNYPSPSMLTILFYSHNVDTIPNIWAQKRDR